MALKKATDGIALRPVEARDYRRDMAGLIAVQHLQPFQLALGRRREDHIVSSAGDPDIEKSCLFLAGAQGGLLAER